MIYFFLWWLIGFVCSLYLIFWLEEQIILQDIWESIGIGMLGIFIPLGFLFIGLLEWLANNRDKVIIRRKKF